MMKMVKMTKRTDTIGCRPCLVIPVCLFFYFFCLLQGPPILAQETPKSEQTVAEKRPISGKKQAGKEREPFEVSPEYMRSRRIEIPEIVVRGIMEGKDNIVAIAEIDLEYERGVSLLQAGDRVSMEARGGARSGKGSTYFIVRSVTRAGICIELENGEKIWYPAMGEE